MRRFIPASIFRALALVFSVGSLALLGRAFVAASHVASAPDVNAMRQSQTASTGAMIGFALCFGIAIACRVASQSAGLRDVGARR